VQDERNDGRELAHMIPVIPTRGGFLMLCFVQEDLLFLADPRAIYDIIIKGHDDFQEPEGFVA
jgi:hypothetical protein